MSDLVDHPEHYNKYKHEVIELAEKFDFCIGNAIKYLLRAPYKGNYLQDLKKALWYLERAQKNGYESPSSADSILKLAQSFEHPFVLKLVRTVLEPDSLSGIIITLKFDIEEVENGLQERERRNEAEEVDLLKEVLENVGVKRIIYDERDGIFIPVWSTEEKDKSNEKSTCKSQ